MLDVILVSFVSGTIPKFVDLIVDREVEISTKLRRGLQPLLPLLGFIGSLLFLYLSTISLELSSLWLAVALACLLSGKIDTFPHRIGFVSYLLGFLVFNLRINVFLVLFLIPFALLDEVGNDLVDSKVVKNELLSKFFKYRLTLEVVVLLISLMIGKMEMWISLFSFDLGYNVITLIIARYQKLKLSW